MKDTPSRDGVAQLLSPRSIAVIGASERAGNLGRTVLDHLIKFGFPGRVYAVHPTATEVSGIACHRSVASLPEVPELVVFALAAQGIADALRECIAAGVRCGIALAGGFSEGDDAGRQRQKLLVELCERSGFVLCGPNCIGVINTGLPMTATFASALNDTDHLLAGNLSVVSQSGGIATFTQSLAAAAGRGMRHVVSSGNEAVTTTADYLFAFAADPQTDVIGVYIEGLRDADRFVRALQAARTAGKRVIVLKAGATPQSALAALAHTGALAGEDRVWDAVLRRQGAIRVGSLEALIDTALYLSGRAIARRRAEPPGAGSTIAAGAAGAASAAGAAGAAVLAPAARAPSAPSAMRGRGVALIGFGGGFGVLGADQCVAAGLALARLEPERIERLRSLTPPIAAIGNPCDLTPDSYNKPEWLARFPAALDEIAAAPDVATVMVVLGATSHKAAELVEVLLAFDARTDCAVVVSWTLAPDAAVQRLQAAGVHVFTEPARAFATLGRVAAAEAAMSIDADTPAPRGEPFDWHARVGPARAGTVVSEHECHAILRAAGLPVADGRFCAELDDAARAARECRAVGYPLALKAISPHFTHRAASGLVTLDIRDEATLARTLERYRQIARARGVELDGVYAQAMVPGGVELIVGASRDPVFGIVVSCGAGGVLTELLDDVALDLAPLTPARAEALLRRLRVVRHALAAPAAPGACDALDLAAVVDFVVRFSALAAQCPWQAFALEANPVKWTAAGATAVDGLLVIPEP